MATVDSILITAIGVVCLVLLSLPYQKLYLTVAMHWPQGLLRPGSQLGVNVPIWSFWDHLTFSADKLSSVWSQLYASWRYFQSFFFAHYSSHRHLRTWDFEDRLANNWCFWWSECRKTWANFLACRIDWVREIVILQGATPLKPNHFERNSDDNRKA